MKKNSLQEIEKLVKKAKEGDNQSMEELVKAFENYIYKAIIGIYVSGYEQQDLIQFGCITVMKAVEKYDIGRGSFVSYVTLAIKNNLRYLIREKAKENASFSLEAQLGEDCTLKDIIKDEEVNVEEDYIKDELVKIMREAVNRLPFKLQEIINYVYLEEKGTLKKYSKDKNINYNTVIKRKNLAFKKLSQALKLHR